MSIKVIKNTFSRRRCTCGYCKSILEYGIDDMEEEKIGMNEYIKVLRCPVCGSRIEIDDGEW